MKRLWQRTYHWKCTMVATASAGITLLAGPQLFADGGDPCSFTWETGCTGGLGCSGACCLADWDDCDRWVDECPGSTCCADCSPQEDSHEATIERDNADTGEDYLHVDLVTLDIESLDIRTSDETDAALDLRFESDAGGGNTLSVETTLTIDGVNGAVDVTVKDSATIRGDVIKLTGGSKKGVTLTVSGGASVESYDPS